MTPIPLDPTTFRTELLRTANSMFCARKNKDCDWKNEKGEKMNDESLAMSCIDDARALMEACGFVEREEPDYTKVCMRQLPHGPPCMKPHPCPIHSQPATCQANVKGYNADHFCGLPLPCRNHP